LPSTEKLTTMTLQLQALMKTPGWKMSDVVDVLNLDELGGWYAGAVVGILLLATYNNQMDKASSSSSTSSATGTVAAPPRRTRAATVPSTTLAPPSDAEKERLESMVVELTRAVNALSVELKELKSEKAATDFALTSMKSDVMTVKSKVEKGGSGGGSSGDTQQLMSKLEKTASENALLKTQLDAAKYEVATLLEVNEALAEGINALSAVDQPKTKLTSSPKPPVTPPPLATKKSKTLPEQIAYFFASENA